MRSLRPHRCPTKAQIIAGWDERNKANRMLLANNIAARQCLLMMWHLGLANIKLSSVIMAFDKKRKLQCSEHVANWADWVTNLQYFPSLFECRVLDVSEGEEFTRDWLVTCKVHDTLMKVADPNSDYKDWMLNSEFGLDDDGKPLDLQAIQQSSWPMPQAPDGSQPAASTTGAPPASGAAAAHANQQPLQVTVPSDGKGPGRSSSPTIRTLGMTGVQTAPQPGPPRAPRASSGTGAGTPRAMTARPDRLPSVCSLGVNGQILCIRF